MVAMIMPVSGARKSDAESESGVAIGMGKVERTRTGISVLFCRDNTLKSEVEAKMGAKVKFER
jgi:hypothetical protein